MSYRDLILILFFYFLVLLQSSFLIHFGIYGVVPNLVLVLVCVLSFFEKPHEYFKLPSVLIAGFFLDIFSRMIIGASIISLVIVYFFIKKTTHFLWDIPRKYSIVYFIPIFVVSIIIYDILFGAFFYLSHRSGFLFPRVDILLIQIIYNLIFATIYFYLSKVYKHLKSKK